MVWLGFCVDLWCDGVGWCGVVVFLDWLVVYLLWLGVDDLELCEMGWLVWFDGGGVGIDVVCGCDCVEWVERVDLCEFWCVDLGKVVCVGFGVVGFCVLLVVFVCGFFGWRCGMCGGFVEEC